MRRWAAGALLAIGWACAGAPPLPAERLSQAESEIRAAQEIGAERVPQARLQLQSARESIDVAKDVNKDDPEAAARKLDIARAQAELANALAREQIARTEAEQAHARLDALRTSATDSGQDSPGAPR